MKEKKRKGWAILNDRGNIKEVFLSKEDADYGARDVSFMGSHGEPDEVIRVEIIYFI